MTTQTTPNSSEQHETIKLGIDGHRVISPRCGRMERMVILVTEHDTPEMRNRAQREGAAAYFRKPIDDQALLDAIAWALSNGP